MKHQTVRDRMNEGEGMVKHAMRQKSHSMKDSPSHHERYAGPTESFHQSMKEESSKGMYRNQVEMPEMAEDARPEMGQGAMPGMGCMDFKGEADPIAYGQAGGPLSKEDEHRIHSQFKDYHWE